MESVKKKRLKRLIKKYMPVYIMMIPILIFLIIFKYYPMYGIILAFKDYLPSKGILGSEFVGFKHFKEIFIEPQFLRALRNTIILSVLKIVFCFPVPIIMSLFLNEIKIKRIRNSIQYMIYLPNFISWVIIGEIVRIVFATGDGLINNAIVQFGGTRKEFLTNPKWFYFIYIFSTIFKEAGWGTVIYMASISQINQELYEAAKIDGASKFKIAMKITLPCISPIIVMMFILAVGNIMNAGFDPIFNLYNKSVYNVADILDTYLYRTGISEGKIEIGVALGLFKSVINFALLMMANTIIKKLNGRGLYD